jgi:peptidoglycan/xylan/chitin deacetylase (PgdA/CDA1 family)
MIKKIVAGIGVVIIALAAVIFWSYSDAIVSVPVADKVVVLTYDDGPNPPHTQGMLDMLGKYGVKATFFPKGRNIEAYPEALRAVAQAGHEIGNHSYHHRPMIGFREAPMVEELERTNRIIEDLLGNAPVLFRPPYGAQGIGLKGAIDELGMKSILMSANGADWEVTDARMIASAILETIEPGGIILLHDGHGDVDDPASQDSRAASVAATGIIIESLQSRGYRFVTVGELMTMASQ